MARQTVVVDVKLGPRWENDLVAAAEPVLDEAAVIVAAGQKRRIPVSVDGSNGRPPGYARDRIHVERGRDAEGPYRDVGSDATTPDGYPYPLGLELGTAPHTIESHGEYPLRDKHGNVFGRVVEHPGTPPYPWCRAALADIVGKVFR
jgi:hypothetical protein